MLRQPAHTPSRTGLLPGCFGLPITYTEKWNDKDSKYFDAPAANWVEGLGLTCDNPVALGYKAAGYNVAWGGMPDPANDPHGVRGSGFNNIYPHFTK